MAVSNFNLPLSVWGEKKFAGLRDEEIFPCVRIYCALYNLVSVNALDGKYGRREIYLKKLDALLGLIWRRYAKRPSVWQRASLLNAAFFILDNASCLAGRAGAERCRNVAACLLDEYVDGYREDAADERELFSVMRLIFAEWYGLVGEEEVPPSLALARAQLAGWIAALERDGHWENLPETAALQRLGLISMNSGLLLDGRYDGELRKLYDYYCIRDLEKDARRLRVRLSWEETGKYALMYEVVRQSFLPDPDYSDCLSRIARLLAPQADRLAGHPEQRLLCQCVAVEDRCRKIAAEFQGQLFAV